MEHKVIKGPSKNPIDRLTFESAEDIHSFIKDSPVETSASTSSPCATSSGFNLHDWDTVLNMLHTGYSEGAAQLDTALETLTQGIGEQDKDVWSMDVTGDFVDIGEYMTGSPECFMKQETIKEFGELVKIKVNSCYMGGVSTTEILNRGAVITALVDAIGRTRPVELEILCVIGAAGSRPLHDLEVRYRVTLEGGYSRDLMAFMLTHPDYLRRCVFAMEDLVYGMRVSGGRGQVKEISKEEQKDCVYFPGLIGNDGYDTMGKAIEKLKELLKPYVSDTAALG